MSEDDALVVKMLLGRGAINPGEHDNNGQAPLWLVPLNGNGQRQWWEYC